MNCSCSQPWAFSFYENWFWLFKHRDACPTEERYSLQCHLGCWSERVCKWNPFSPSWYFSQWWTTQLVVVFSGHNGSEKKSCCPLATQLSSSHCTMHHSCACDDADALHKVEHRELCAVRYTWYWQLCYWPVHLAYCMFVLLLFWNVFYLWKCFTVKQ